MVRRHTESNAKEENCNINDTIKDRGNKVNIRDETCGLKTLKCLGIHEQVMP